MWGSREVLLKPDKVLLWAPNNMRLQAGILARLVRPPAIPKVKQPIRKLLSARPLGTDNSGVLAKCTIWKDWMFSVALTHDLGRR